jgi:Lar family restriction alleviation protein
MNNDLKPCPFCGYASPKITEKRSGNYRRTGDMFQILCGKCKARGPIYTAKYTRSGEYGKYNYAKEPTAQLEAQQKAIDAWNRRAT